MHFLHTNLLEKNIGIKYMEQWFGSTKAGNKHKGISKKNEMLFIYYN